MKVTVYLTAEACEARALEPSTQLACWHFGVCFSGQDLSYPHELPKGALVVFEQEFTLPSNIDYLQAAKTSLEEELKRKMAEAHQVEMGLKTRLANLLAIGFEG